MRRNSRSFLQQQAFFFYFRDHSAPHTPQSSKATKYPSQATLRSAGYSGHHSTAIYLTDGCCPLIPMMSALLEMNTIESVTMTKCTCVYPSVAKAGSSIFCSLIFNTFFWKKKRGISKRMREQLLSQAWSLPASSLSLGTLMDTGQQCTLRGLCYSGAEFLWSLSDEHRLVVTCSLPRTTLLMHRVWL